MEEFRMKLRVHMLVFATLATAAVAFSQVTVDGPFQIRYASNLLTGGEGVINITNSGAAATGGLQFGVTPAQNNINGSICVNIYTFAADEQEVACCSCLITPNALWSASVKTALINSTLTPSMPNEVVIKLISTHPNVDSHGTESCDPGQISQSGSTDYGPGTLSNGLLAWGTSVHAVGTGFQMAETPFLPP